MGYINNHLYVTAKMHTQVHKATWRHVPSSHSAITTINQFAGVGQAHIQIHFSRNHHNVYASQVPN